MQLKAKILILIQFSRLKKVKLKLESVKCMPLKSNLYFLKVNQ